MKGNGRTIELMVKVNSLTAVAISTKETGLMTRPMGTEFSLMLMDRNIMVTG